MSSPDLHNVLFRSTKSNTNLLYQHQSDQSFLWLETCTHAQIRNCIKLLFLRCNLSTKRYFCTLLEPLLHRDFIYHEYELKETPFKTISSFVSREKQKKLEQELKSKKRETFSFYRLKSAHLSNESDVNIWTRACVFPSIKHVENNHHTKHSDITTPISHTSIESKLPKLNYNTNRKIFRTKSEIFHKISGSSKDFQQCSKRRVKSVPLFNEVRLRTSRRHLQDARISNRKKLNSTTQLQFDKCFIEEKTIKLVEWFCSWTREQQEDFLGLFVKKLDPYQLYYLYGFLMVRLTSDFTQILPEMISLRIFKYLKPSQLKLCCKVNKRWRQLCSHNILWEKICSAKNISLLGHTSYMKAFYYNKVVENNWADGRPSIKDVSLHQSSILTIDVFNDYLMATGGTDKLIKVWDLRKEWHQPMVTLEGHSKAVWGVKFLTELMLISCSGDHTIKIWNLQRMVCVRSMSDHENAVWCLQLVGDTLYSGSADRTVKIWNLRSGKVTSTLAPHPGGVYCIALSHDHTKLYAGTVDKTIRIWDLTTPGLCLETIHVESTKITPSPIVSLSTSLPGYLFSCCANSYQIWDLETSKMVKLLKDVHKDRITCAQFLPKYKRTTDLMSRDLMEEDIDAKIVTTSKDGKLRVWKLHSNTPIQNLSCAEIGNVMFCTRTHIYVGTHTGSLKIYSFA